MICLHFELPNTRKLHSFLLLLLLNLPIQTQSNHFLSPPLKWSFEASPSLLYLQITVMVGQKRQRFSPEPFEDLPDDLVICILSKLCSTSSSPSDFINVLLVCKRFNKLGLNQLVLSNSCSGIFAMRAQNWSESAHNFLKLCVNANSVEACYFLGMIQFYCLENRGGGASLMAKAAIKSHVSALYSLAVIQLNGSGGSKCGKDLRAGVALCARAAYLGHVGSLRELGHCLKDGYGIKQHVAEGRRLLIQANAREFVSFLPAVALSSLSLKWEHRKLMDLLSDFGTNIPNPKPKPINRFLTEWFELHELGSGMTMCSNSRCGRPETRAYEFRRCSVCSNVNYCSRGCQALDWKVGHRVECSPQLVNVGPIRVNPHG